MKLIVCVLALVALLLIAMKMDLFRIMSSSVLDVTQFSKEATEKVGEAAQTALDATGASVGDLAKGVVNSGAEVVETIGNTSAALLEGNLSAAADQAVSGTLDVAQDFVKGGLNASYTAYEGAGDVYAGAFS